MVELLKKSGGPFLFRLTDCGLTMESCITLAEVLSSYPCFLTELDLSNNRLQKEGVQQLSEGLRNCNLKILRYSNISLFNQCNSPTAKKRIRKYKVIRKE